MAQIGSRQRQLADLVHKSLGSLAAPVFHRKDVFGDLPRSYNCLGESMPTLYVETSIVSYLQSRPSGQVVAAARQLLTHKWWTTERSNYELVTSQYVLDEAADGDSAVARRRLEALKGIPTLPMDAAILDVAEEILRKAILPRSASVDALHIATVAHHQVDYLLTWNCTHIANARILPKVFEVLDSAGLTRPIICTPEELLTDVAETD